MNKQEFERLWSGCIVPSFTELYKQDQTLYLREGSSSSLCRCYNSIKNNTKRLFMKNSGSVRLDRHKIAACLAKAIVVVRPIGKTLDDGYTGTEDEFPLANEALAFSVSLSILRAFIELKLKNKALESGLRKDACQKICDSDFIFPDTIIGVDYSVSVCWAWHHNITNGNFDVLGTANLFFMIENYSIEAYCSKIKSTD